MENYKEKIMDYIEGRLDPETFYTWFESNPKVMDWLQGLIPANKVIQDSVQEKIDYFLRDLEACKQDEIYSVYHELCRSMESNNGEQVHCAKTLVGLLDALDRNTVKFTNLMNLLLSSFQCVLDDPLQYQPSYVQHILESVVDFIEKTHDTVQYVPYNVKTVYAHKKTRSKLETYVNIQSWLYHLMTELFPDETLQRDNTLAEKAAFLYDVCPEYIEGCEVDEAGIVEKLIEQVPETLPKAKRAKQIKELIKKEFHIEGTKYPRWIQGGEWPVSKSGKPMRFVKQKQKKGKGYENMLYTVYEFEDVDTLEIRTVEQFT